MSRDTNMRLEDSRRLTGPNLFSKLPGAICDILIDRSRQADLAFAWRRHVGDLLEAVGWGNSQCFHRLHETGVCLVITAPIDALYAATEVNEAAFEFARCELDDTTLPPLDETVTQLRSLIVDEQNPKLIALQDAAAARGAPFLADDDEVSVGYGHRTQIWNCDSLPSPEQVDWDQAGHYGEVPVALVTGTNGKSTTVRLAASILAASGRTTGVTSTDYIRVGDETIDTGDYSGPGGARTLLRHPQTQVALLEVARGGMLRRGLGVTNADAALITNIAADHLGEYGIHTVEELRDAKFIVHKGLADRKFLVLNADDAGIVEFARQLPAQRFIWFSENAEHPLIEGHCMAGGEGFVVSKGHLAYRDRGGEHLIMPINDIPVTLFGKARHNVQNALAAAALGHVLGCDHHAISKGLRDFHGGPAENPGRGNIFRGKGVQAIVDFAHNEHGLSSVAQTVAAMPAQRRLVLLGQAGDRSDALIEGLVHAALKADPDQLVVCRLPGYERGRLPDDVPDLITDIAVAAGLSPDAIHRAASPVDGTRFALEWSRVGDLMLILALTQRGPVTQLIEEGLGAAS
ncbi:MAG: Mur ligase family protein [Pseudomonadota bacterium]